MSNHDDAVYLGGLQKRLAQILDFDSQTLATIIKALQAEIKRRANPENT